MKKLNFLSELTMELCNAFNAGTEKDNFIKIIYDRLTEAKRDGAIIIYPFVIINHKHDNNWIICDVREGYGYDKLDIEFTCNHKPTSEDVERAIRLEYSKSYDRFQNLSSIIDEIK